MSNGMKRLCIVALFSTVLFAAGPEIPRKAPEFAIQTGPEKYIWLNQFAGKTVVLVFILTDCSHCQFTARLLNEIQKDYADRGVQVVASAIDTMSALHIPDFVAKFKTAFPVGYNEGNYAAKFLGYPENDPMLMPQIAFIDRNGAIRAQFAGDDTRLLTDVQDKTLRETLDETIKDAQPAQKKGQAATRPSTSKK
jgi:peroxiredoxin